MYNCHDLDVECSLKDSHIEDLVPNSDMILGMSEDSKS